MVRISLSQFSLGVHLEEISGILQSVSYLLVSDTDLSEFLSLIAPAFLS
jgi:hypothetical protein